MKQTSRTISAALALIVLLAQLVSCVSGNVQPYRTNDSIQPATDGENRLWYQAQKYEQALKKSGQVYENEEMTAYLQSVMNRLYPDFEGHIRVYILKAPVLNAFALPNGSIYINTGLLTAMENEAQLATVLAHEGAHFTQKHAALQRENYHNSTGLRMAVAILGIPFLGDLAAISSIFGYSKHHEREADELGHARLLAAGYDINESPRAFEHLLIEAKANKDKEPFFFSTHPTLASRIENFEALNAATPQSGTRTGTETYEAHIGTLRLATLKEKVVVGKYDAVIAVLALQETRQRYGDQCYYYLGEAYRLRNDPGDIENAMAAYEQATSRCRDFAPPYRSLGILLFKSGDNRSAVNNFRKYLALNPDADDAAFVRMYLQQARDRMPEGKGDQAE